MLKKITKDTLLKDVKFSDNVYLNTRIRNYLLGNRRELMTTVGELLEIPEWELLKIKNLGRGSVDAIKQFLHSNNMQLPL